MTVFTREKTPNNALELNASDLTLCDSMVLRNIFWRILWISKWISFGWRIHYIKVLWSLVLFWSFRHSKQAKSTNFIKNTSENAKEGFQFRWLKIKGNATAYYILITLFVNHLNWKFRNRSALENYDWSNPRKTIQSLINFYKLNFTWSLLIKSLFSKIWLFSKIGLSKNFLRKFGKKGDFHDSKSQFQNNFGNYSIGIFGPHRTRTE